VRLVGDVKRHFGVDLPLRTLFDHPCFADFARAVPATPAARGIDRIAALLGELETLE